VHLNVVRDAAAIGEPNIAKSDCHETERSIFATYSPHVGSCRATLKALAVQLPKTPMRLAIRRELADVFALEDSFTGSAGLRHAVAIVTAGTAAPIAVIDRYLDLI
jgi:hypothetical protein